MNLYHYITLEAFVDAWSQKEATTDITLSAFNLMYAVPEEEYMFGLNQLRKAIKRHEKINNIPLEQSKKDMPFFRDNSRTLVGHDLGMYVLSFYESRAIEEQVELSDEPLLAIEFDYNLLAEHCLSESMQLVRCKYDKEQVTNAFVSQLRTEYDKVFVDKEHTGFTADSQFFAMLCQAALEIKSSAFAAQKEWRLAAMKSAEDANYFYAGGALLPYTPIALPLACIKRITLLNYEEEPLVYGALEGLMKKIGLAPERFLTGRIEE